MSGNTLSGGGGGGSATGDIVADSLNVIGNTIIGDSSTDTCIVNAQTTFNNNTTFGNASTDSSTFVANVFTQSNLTVGVSSTNKLACQAQATFFNGQRFTASQNYFRMDYKTGNTNSSGNVTFTSPASLFASLPVATVSCVVNDANMRPCWFTSATYNLTTEVATFIARVVDTSNTPVVGAQVNCIMIGPAV